MLPASGIVCTVHCLPVLCQERLMLATRQDAEDTLRVERILLLGGCAVDCRDRWPRKGVGRLCGVLAQWCTMTDFELVTATDVQLMQGLAQRVTATRPDLISADASYGELAWIWGKGRAPYGATWPRRLWFSGDELVAWSWAFLPHQVRRNDGKEPGPQIRWPAPGSCWTRWFTTCSSWA